MSCDCYPATGECRGECRRRRESNGRSAATYTRGNGSQDGRDSTQQSQRILSGFRHLPPPAAPAQWSVGPYSYNSGNAHDHTRQQSIDTWTSEASGGLQPPGSAMPTYVDNELPPEYHSLRRTMPRDNSSRGERNAVAGEPRSNPNTLPTHEELARRIDALVDEPNSWSARAPPPEGPPQSSIGSMDERDVRNSNGIYAAPGPATESWQDRASRNIGSFTDRQGYNSQDDWGWGDRGGR